MKKYSFILIMLCFFALIALEGCAKTPEEVKDEINKKQGFTENLENNNPDLEYDTIDHIFETIDDVKTQNFVNLEFAHEFKINTPEEIGVMKFHQINNFLDYKIDKIKDFIGDSYNEKYVKLDNNPTRPSSEYDDKSKQLYCGMKKMAFILMNRKMGMTSLLNQVMEL